jgi:hypothetical protein
MTESDVLAGGHRTINAAYLDTLRTPRMLEEPKYHEAVTLEEVRAMAHASVVNLREQHIRAAAIFLFLSGMRVGAFTSLPLEAVNMAKRTVLQWPGLGVRTKGGKHATTYLLPLPDLLHVVQVWDDFVREILPPSGLWFAPLAPTTGELDPDLIKGGPSRHTKVRRGPLSQHVDLALGQAHLEDKHEEAIRRFRLE